MLELLHTRTLPVPLRRAWTALDDVDRVSAALPGAVVREVGRDDDGRPVVSGAISLKVGPIVRHYEGSVTVVGRDPEARTFGLTVDGTEVGGVSRLLASTLVGLRDDDGTRTTMLVAMNAEVTGKLAGYGQSVIDELVGRLLDGLVENLAAAGYPEAPELPDEAADRIPAFAPDAEPAPEASSGAEPGPRSEGPSPAAGPAGDGTAASGPAAVPAVRPTAVIRPQPGVVPVAEDEEEGEDEESLAAKVAPYVAMLLVLIILRRMFGAGD